MKMSTISIDRYIIQRAVVYYAENAKCSFISLYKNIHSQSGEMVGSSAERERTHTHTRKCRVARNETHATDIKIFFSWMQFGWFSEFGHGVYVSLIECAAFLSSLMCYFPYFSIISIHIKLIENVRFVRIISFHWYLHNFIRSLSISLCKWCFFFSLSSAKVSVWNGHLLWNTVDWQPVIPHIDEVAREQEKIYIYINICIKLQQSSIELIKCVVRVSVCRHRRDLCVLPRPDEMSRSFVISICYHKTWFEAFLVNGAQEIGESRTVTAKLGANILNM